MKLKRTNKLLALLLAVLMVMSLLPVAALAAPMAERTEPASGEAGGDDAYEINGDAKPALRAAAKGSGLLGASSQYEGITINYTLNGEAKTAHPVEIGTYSNEESQVTGKVYLLSLPYHCGA